MDEKKEVGVIKRIGEVKQFSEKFKALDFDITTGGEYPQVIRFQVTQDKCDTFNQYNKVGDSVEVLFNLRGREWIDPKTNEVKVFNTLTSWRVNKLDNTVPQEMTVGADDQDLPF